MDDVPDLVDGRAFSRGATQHYGARALEKDTFKRKQIEYGCPRRQKRSNFMKNIVWPLGKKARLVARMTIQKLATQLRQPYRGGWLFKPARAD